MISSSSPSTSPAPIEPGPLLRRLPLLLTALIVGVWAVRVALAWDRLPARMASHFDSAGAPNGWMSKAGFFAFDLLLGGGLGLLFVTAPRWLRHLPPEMVNLPASDYWLAPQRIEASLRRIGPWMAWLAVGTTGFILGISDLALQANLEGATLHGGGVRVAVAAFLFGIVIWSLLFYRAFRRPRDA
jgi:hypothetical protein